VADEFAAKGMAWAPIGAGDAEPDPSPEPTP